MCIIYIINFYYLKYILTILKENVWRTYYVYIFIRTFHKKCDFFLQVSE